MVSQLQSQTEQAQVIYPDSDGKPMANNTKQFRWIVVIQQNLDWLYANDPNVFVAGDLFWYPVEGKPKIVNAPDVMVVLGRPKGNRGSYQQWNEDNVAPQVVFEILSPGNTQEEMERKLLFYDRYGVQEYYIYNPDNNQLRGWIQDEEGLDTIASLSDWISPQLGIRFDLSGEELQIYHPDGTRFLSYTEINQQLEQERQRVQQAEEQLEQERQRAEAERQRAEAMEELLRQYRDRFGELPE
ncbi:MAG: Uma2 family endonuclease [Symplocastrum torsivum CPER-KK1]|jgi:Uma2 family endonuclease|uniref:Uma2 family endonuclease n=1 Tax=Symplocastrum torsivum CPER-KK1 TaxID=450513 RepID=A0A951PLT4_9CYAN|nr:Uma2 family endonuclease [Symplocastrum torsivum CPER-KK1]